MLFVGIQNSKIPINATKKMVNATSRKGGFLITVRPPRIPILIIASVFNMDTEFGASPVWGKLVHYLWEWLSISMHIMIGGIDRLGRNQQYHNNFFHVCFWDSMNRHVMSI